jgi:hypothetical protein
MNTNKVFAITAIGYILFLFSGTELLAQNNLVDTSPLAASMLQEVKYQRDSLLPQKKLLLNSLSIGGYLVTAGQFTGGGDFTGVMTSISYERWINPTVGCEISVRYMDFFYNNPVYFTTTISRPGLPTVSGMSYQPQRWLRASWGSDALIMLRPSLISSQLRVGVGIAFDSQLIFKTFYHQYLTDTSLASFARVSFSEQVFFGIAVRVEYGIPIGETADIVLRSQMYLQSNNLFRPIRRQDDQYYGALLLGASLRVHF